MRADPDVCVIGGGPAGLTAALALAERGLRVRVLEAGPGSRPGEQQSYDDARLVGGAAGYRRTSAAKTEREAANPWTLSGLGGGMSRFAGLFLRMRESDFHRRPEDLPGADLDPAWPISYDELREWYDLVEERYGIARSDEPDLPEPPSADPVMSPHPFSPLARRVTEAAGPDDLQWRPTPLAINSRAYRGRPACTRLHACNEMVCPSGAKADARRELSTSPAARALVEITTDARVRRLLSTPDGVVTGAEWVRGEGARPTVQRANVFLLAANAVQSAALLLRSASSSAPAGLANDHDMVGRALSLKTSGYVTARFPRQWDLGEGGDCFSTILTTSCYERLPTGGGPGGLLYEAQRAGRPRGEFRLHAVVADSPRRENRVLLDCSSSSGVLLQYQPHGLDTARLDELLRLGVREIEAAGGTVDSVERVPTHLGAGHLLGGCRAGDSPLTSVVDRFGRLHGSPNAFVVDGGFFPYASAVNPTMTIIANALRIVAQLDL